MHRKLENLLKSNLSHHLNHTKLAMTHKYLPSSSSKSDDTNRSVQYCLQLVKKHDYENFLATLLLTGQCRRTAFALRAFNVEIAKIAGQVSDDKIGTMRLKFWYDALDEMYNPAANRFRDHPVLKELKLSIDTHNLPKMYLMRLIKSRERPTNLGFVTGKHLEQYAEETVSPVYYLLAKAAKGDNLDVDHAASHLGKAQGIVNLLRAQRYQGRAKVISVPQEILLKHGASHERVLRDRVDDRAVQECIFEVASLANSHLDKAKNLSAKVPSDVRRVFLPAIAIGRYLERLRRVNFHLSNPKLAQRDALLPFAYYWNKLRGKY